MKPTKEVSPNLWDDYLSLHLKPTKRECFYRVVKPLKAFKAARSLHSGAKVIVSLLIPAGAIIYCPHENSFKKKKLGSGRRTTSWMTGLKMRATRAMVAAMSTRDTHESVSVAYSIHDFNFKYHVGDIVKPKEGVRFFYTYTPCTTGIHFFITLGEARGY